MNTVNSHCIAESHRCKPAASYFPELTPLETNMQSSSERLLCGKHKQNLNRALCACVDVHAREYREERGREKVRENSLFWRRKGSECFSVKRPGPEVVPNVGLRLNSTR
ncbi:hypothetical protein QQF64_027909 [Cirrhinus molitorella]|uniref:Uncharacterized protein n=1 Tax=Cirrhinus molitorella TaxID=172907 RepID=A0ABR3NEJ8_9TELE